MDAVQSIHEEDVISYIYYRDIENKKEGKGGIPVRGGTKDFT